MPISRRSFLGLAMTACLPTSASAPLPEQPLALPARFHRGIGYAHLHNRRVGYGSETSRAQLQILAALGVTHVALMPFAYMPSLEQPTLRWGGDRSMPDDALVAEAEAIRALGMVPVLKPHIWAGAGGFPGDMQMASTAAWQEWFAVYGRFIEEQAVLAQRMNAGLFCLGTECTHASLQNPGAWAALAQRVRGLYSGPLTYAANWYQEIEGFTDWDAFDFIGVNAYFPLSERSDPTLQELMDGWTPHLDMLDRIAARFARPILFTEAGYEAIRGAATRPWNAGRGRSDEALQARAYEALLRSCAVKPWFEGVYWWKWFTGGRDNGMDESDFVPQGREAERVLRRWFTSQRY